MRGVSEDPSDEPPGLSRRKDRRDKPGGSSERGFALPVLLLTVPFLDLIAPLPQFTAM